VTACYAQISYILNTTSTQLLQLGKELIAAQKLEQKCALLH